MKEDNIPKYYLDNIKETKEKKLTTLDLSCPSIWGDTENIFISLWRNLSSSRVKPLTEVPQEVFTLKHLQVLDLSNNKITSIPESISNFTKLIELNLSKNKIIYISESIGNLAKLTRLDLSNNKITNIPESIGNFTSLTRLYLFENQITSIPESIGNLINLTGVNLSNNKITSIPESIGNLINLTGLYLSNNKITSIPESISNLTKLTRLDLSNNKITSIPESISNLTKLTRLFLSNNKITSIPESIGNLTKLTRLFLSNNKITSIPESIGNLTKLTRLFLSNNKITSIPESIGNLTKLTGLYLFNNQIISIPESIGNLANLTKLYLFRNQIKSIPESITNLNNLTILTLHSNQITNIPESIGNLANLTELYLSNNKITNIPESIGNLTNLTKLDLFENPLVTPPIEVALEGVTAIQEYFRQLQDEGEDYIYEAKLLIVGEARAGKTSLAMKIHDAQYEIRDNQPSTEGIDVIQWSFSLDNGREFKVNIWDFGGQAIYHATHQFFLTKRSLYALVSDSRKEDTDFYFWLNIVEQLSDNSPLLIIKNEKQERQRNINEKALRGQFTNLKETLATNLKTNRGLDNILIHLQDYLKKLPQIGQVLPKTWVTVRRILESQDQDYISLEDFRQICQANQLTRHDDQLQLSRYLHDLGVCLHFQDEADSLLYRIVILKPEWGTDAVYQVLDNQHVIDHLGQFTRQDLSQIWQDQKYLSKRGELLELMKKFQLCYEIPGRKDTFIAPQLLSNNEPEYDWDQSRNLILRYRYADFMPKGIVTRFIVAMHRYIEEQKYVWRSGVILNKDNTRAEVIEYYGKREIRIRIAGAYKRELLNTVSYELDKIHDAYHRLKYSKLMPCNCLECKDSQSPYFYPFDELRRFIAKQQYKIQCRDSFEMVNVLSLIDDVVDLQKLIPPGKKDREQLIYIKQPNFISGDVQELIRKIIINDGNYNESIAGDYIDRINNKSPHLEISDNATVNNSGAGGFSLGDIQGKLANTLNQLPNFEDQPHQQQLKNLLQQLTRVVIETNLTNLDEEETTETLEEIQAIAFLLNNSQDAKVKKTAKRAAKVLRGTAANFPATTELFTICQQLPELINKIS